ncbi:MAG: type II toxin-antitoxin system VapC family toxin [Acidimicrobiales bacterium]
MDSHVLIWALADHDELTPSLRSALVDPTNDIVVSAASVWEIRIKQALGRLDAPPDLTDAIAQTRFRALPISFEHAVAAADLPPLHRDPFDRMLVAQAQAENLTLVTRDRSLAEYQVATLLL